MSDPDQQDGENKKEWINADEFRDLPTSDEHGGYISYFDTVLWIEDHLGTVEGDSWDASEQRICVKCETGELAAWGYKASNGIFERNLSQIPQGSWPNLQFDMANGQPAHDRKKHGDRWYGQALTVELEEGSPINFRRVRRDDPKRDGTADPEGHRSDFNGVRPEVAWTAVCFLKSDVLKHWPAMPEREESGGGAFKEPEKGVPPLHAQIHEAVNQLWPDGNLPARVNERDIAIENWFRKNQQIPPSFKTIHRALSKHNKP